ncbi:uncharacterized protein LOC121786989 [Salvia splendens]|uniref:uncharacterized protein LOC121786989 n=1 Tax=Salvia splendens TaxID=180675 RepID=UPI001C2656EC|nr:uncharacterized protein LOC121786989 [Salvia splendens]
MACCLYSLQCSRAWLALLVPICAVLSSSSHGSFLIPIIFIFLFTLSKRKPQFHQEKQQPTLQEEVVLMGSQDLYSESESMEQFSSSEDHSSDMEQRLDCSDGSISDEESLIEIEIPSGQFVWNGNNVKCCKEFHKDFWGEMNEFNEEDDNLIEIDIKMGFIKC